MSAAVSWLTDAQSSLKNLHARGVHAVLLHGPSGIGKWQTAMQHAHGLLCRNAGDAMEACNECDDCRLVAAGNHPDLRVIVPDAWADRRPGGDAGTDEGETAGAASGEASAPKGKPSREIRIDAVRSLGSLFQISAHRGGYRVVVLGPAEQFNPAAGNAILKSLEEPPPQTKFILVSDRLDRCLPTVLSRCALIRVPVPRHDEACAWLAMSGVPADDSASWLAKAGGAPMKALNLFAAGPDASEAILLGLLQQATRLRVADIAAQVPRQLEMEPALATLQRWAWDWIAMASGAAPRYYPEQIRACRDLVTAGSWRGAESWQRSLRAMVMTAEHPLNAKLCVEAALIEYRKSIEM